MDRQRKERAIWEKLASGYDARTLKTYEKAYDLSIQKICSVLSPDHRVLEIGCGTGIISLGIAPYAANVVATDLSPKMIAAAQAKMDRLAISNVNFEVGDGYSLPYPSESFDVVLLFNTLHVVKEPAVLLREAHRLLKPSGQLVTATDCYAEPAPLATRIVLGIQRFLNLVGFISFMRFYRKADLVRLFEQCSFVVAETDTLHPAPVNYYVLARKQNESG